MLIFAAEQGKVYLVRKIRGPDRGHLFAMKVSICPVFLQYLSSMLWRSLFVQYLSTICPVLVKYLSSIYPLCYEGQYHSRFNFPAGVEEGTPSGEKEENRAHKDGAAGMWFFIFFSLFFFFFGGGRIWFFILFHKSSPSLELIKCVWRWLRQSAVDIFKNSPSLTDKSWSCVCRCLRQSAIHRSSSPCITPFKRQQNFISSLVREYF